MRVLSLISIHLLLFLCFLAMPYSLKAQHVEEGSDDWLMPSIEFVETHRERLEGLFQSLDLETKDLEVVRESYQSGSLRSACHELLRYYQNNTTPKGFLPVPRPLSKLARERAVLALNERGFSLQDIAGYPYNNETGTYDWSHKGPNDDIEWAWLFNRHDIFLDLIALWKENKDPACIALINEMLASWVKANPAPAFLSFSPAWRALEAARRIEAPWIEAFALFQDEPLFTPETRLLLLSSLPDHANYLERFHAFGGNHKVTEMMALLLISLVWDEFQEADRWHDYALKKIEEELFAQTYPDGAHKELANHYQRVVLLSFQRAVELLKAAKLEHEANLLKPRIREMWEFYVYSAKPHGYGPLNNDSDTEDNRFVTNKYAFEVFDEGSWKYILSHGHEGTEPKGLASRYFPWAGQLFMRDNWGIDAFWGYFDIGPYGTDHQHLDHLHVSISLGQRDILLDNGRYTYTPGPERDYFKNTRSHNTVTLNRTYPQSYPKEVSEPLPHEVNITEAFDYACARVAFNHDSSTGKGKSYHKRHVIFWKQGAKHPFWVVIDDLIHAGPAKWQTYWHFSPDADILVDGTASLTTYPIGWNLAVIPVGFTPDIRLFKGSTEPDYQGWFSPTFNEKRSATATVYETRTLSPTRQLWVLMPFEQAEASDSPQTRESTDMLELLWSDGYSDRVPLNPEYYTKP